MSMINGDWLWGLVVVLIVECPPPGAVWAGRRGSGEQETGVPAFTPGPPAKDAQLPPILGKDQLWGNNEQYPFQTHAYELAAKIQPDIYQQPCYCYCDRMGHKSLHSCFEGTHGAQCTTCTKELYSSYRITN